MFLPGSMDALESYFIGVVSVVSFLGMCFHKWHNFFVFSFLNPFCQIVLHRQLWEFKSGQRVCCFGSCFASSS